MIDFKTNRLKAEFDELEKQNPRLHKLLGMLSLYCEIEFKKNIVLTCIQRTDEENKAAGGIPSSPHIHWMAADIRSTTFTETEIKKIVQFLNCVSYPNGKQTALYHAVPGGAPHVHVQCRK